jgi:hypothetical protein
MDQDPEWLDPDRTDRLEDPLLLSKPMTTPHQYAYLAGLPMMVLALFLFLVIVLTSGCSQSARPSDQEEGRKALQTTLDTWKGGGNPDSLAQRSPSIHASDGDWKSGLILQNYRADGDGKLVGSDLNYSVELKLKNPRGGVTKKTAVYAVTTHPQFLVLRLDE